ncbi:hypothetical protein A6R68_00693, partial [Neotoma lepida]
MIQLASQSTENSLCAMRCTMHRGYEDGQGKLLETSTGVKHFSNNGRHKEANHTSSFTAGDIKEISKGSYGVYGAEVQLLQLTLIETQSNVPQGDNVVVFPEMPSMPHQVVPLVFQNAFHDGTELLGISVPQVLQQLLGLVQILLQVGFHDCLDVGDSVSEDRRLDRMSKLREVLHKLAFSTMPKLKPAFPARFACFTSGSYGAFLRPMLHRMQEESEKFLFNSSFLKKKERRKRKAILLRTCPAHAE